MAPLQTISQTRLEEFARDPGFRKLLHHHLASRRETLEARTWFQESYPSSAEGASALGPVAYFSMEFGLSEALPIYGGGLGILAGDYLKAASDLGVPAVGVGLLYQRATSAKRSMPRGAERVLSVQRPGQLPMMPVRDSDGEWLRITIELPGAPWAAGVGGAGRAGEALPARQQRPHEQPGGPRHHQRAVRGRAGEAPAAGDGAWVSADGGCCGAGHRPEICHLNEGHAALAVMERARAFMDDNSALRGCAGRHASGKHLHHPYAGRGRFRPVPAGLASEYLGRCAAELGSGCRSCSHWAAARREPPRRRGAAEHGVPRRALQRGVNGVSRLHGEVSRRLFQPLFPRWPARRSR